MNNPPASKRRNVFIKKAFQTRFIVGAIGLILLSSLSSALLIYWITGSDLQSQSQSAHTNIVTAWERLGLSILLGNIVAIIVTGAVGVSSVLYASHKIAGPLYRFETLCREIGAGNLDAVTQLRDDDQLQELAQAFSGMVGKLRVRREQRGKLITDIHHQISSLGLKNTENSSMELQNTISALKTHMLELQKLENQNNV